jgi:hypothetical protein
MHEDKFMTELLFNQKEEQSELCTDWKTDCDIIGPSTGV